MGGEAGSEGGEPEGLGGGVVLEALGEGKEDGGARHVAVASEDLAGLGEGEAGEGGFECFDDIAAAGVGEDLRGLFRELSVKASHGLGSKLGDAAVELVLEFPGGVGEADFLAVGGNVLGVEGMESTGTLVGGRAGEDRCSGSIAEEAEGNEDAGIVIDVKGGG